MSISRKIQGNWHEIKGAIKENWGKITDNELNEINGHREKLVGMIMKKYNLSEKSAENAVGNFWRRNKS